MFAWATAGSTSGNTTDPIRGAVWVWLGAHLAPFQLTATSSQSSGYLSILPLGAIIFPIWAVHRTFPRVVETAPTIRAARIFYTATYTVIAIALSLISTSHSVTPMWYYAGLCAGITAFVSTFTIHLRPALSIIVSLFAVMWGVSSILLGLSFIAHWRVVHDLSVVVAPGIVGAILFTLLQILYLPNMALAALGYFTGSGFSLGAHTMVTPSIFTLHQIPAIPLLGALPTGIHPILWGGVVFWPFLYLASYLVITRIHFSWKSRNKEILRTFILSIFFAWEISYFASGELLTPSMKRVGILPERTTLIAASSALLIALIFFYIPSGVKKVMHRE